MWNSAFSITLTLYWCRFTEPALGHASCFKKLIKTCQLIGS
ncbi:hypothetical protein PISS_a2679 [Pseudoalteromonas issachenkonii]|uniref:Uncharacterized protein n=1 Tax=Pseudoalteromonas issachenkonii TaxID=152297 RepID=A0ABM6N547_9GAMM|nr:hypothetical protein PISS_a2679 [Pseudoalteromonas issachenkonii]